jgi:predicted transcriptional regulator
METRCALFVLIPSCLRSPLHNFRDGILFHDRESTIPATGIEQTASIEEALNTMLRKQFSQLPVVDKDNRLIGEFTVFMVTNESILRALRNLNAVPAKLKVSDAMVRVRPYRLEDRLSDLLKDANVLKI